LETGRFATSKFPVTDIVRSAGFYGQVFGWQIRKRGDGSTAFDDGVGEVSGVWVLGRPAASTPGLMVHTRVDSVAATLNAIVAKWG